LQANAMNARIATARKILIFLFGMFAPSRIVQTALQARSE